MAASKEHGDQAGRPQLLVSLPPLVSLSLSLSLSLARRHE